MRSVVIVALLAGCGLAQTQNPPRPPTTERPTCTTSMSAPKRDLIGVGVGLVLALYGIISLDTSGNEALATPLLVGGGITFAASASSGAVGRARVKRCRKAIAEHGVKP